MNPGALDQKLVFQLPAGAVDEDGFPIDSPSTYTTAWGALKTLKGKAFYAAAQVNMQHNRVFTIRYQRKLMDGVRPKNLTVLWKGINHDIVSIENDDGQNVSMTVILKVVG